MTKIARLVEARHQTAADQARADIDMLMRVLPSPGSFFPMEAREAWLVLFRWCIKRAYKLPPSKKPFQEPDTPELDDYLW